MAGLPVARISVETAFQRNDGPDSNIKSVGWALQTWRARAMSREDTLRQKAAELRQQARAEVNVSTRLELELLALSYDRLADQAASNARNNIVYEYDPETTAEWRLQRRRLGQAQQQHQPQRPKRHQ